MFSGDLSIAILELGKNDRRACLPCVEGMNILTRPAPLRDIRNRIRGIFMAHALRDLRPHHSVQVSTMPLISLNRCRSRSSIKVLNDGDRNI